MYYFSNSHPHRAFPFTRNVDTQYLRGTGTIQKNAGAKVVRYEGGHDMVQIIHYFLNGIIYSSPSWYNGICCAIYCCQIREFLRSLEKRNESLVDDY